MLILRADFDINPVKVDILTEHVWDVHQRHSAEPNKRSLANQNLEMYRFWKNEKLSSLFVRINLFHLGN